MPFELADLIIMQLALTAYFKDIDLSLSAARQIQQTIGKTEYHIQQLQSAHVVQASPKLQPDPPKPDNK